MSYFDNLGHYEHRGRPAFDEQMENDLMGYIIERKIEEKLKNNPNRNL
jgi:hypothetical protein